MADPITLTGLAIASLFGGAASKLFKSDSAPAAEPKAPAAQAAPASSPQTKPQTVSQQPTFLGAAAAPPTQSGQKTLLGQ